MRTQSGWQNGGGYKAMPYVLEMMRGAVSEQPDAVIATNVPVRRRVPDAPKPRASETAHDLANYVQAIGSAIRLIEARLDPVARADLQPLTEGASAAARRATSLARELLDLPGSRTEVTELVNLGTAVRAIQPLIRLTAGTSVQVKIEIDDDLPVVSCRRPEFEDAIVNLVINARTAMPSGGVLTISIYGESFPSNDDADGAEGASSAVLRVRDTGSGTSADIAGLAFRPYFTTTPPKKGDGLGLAMVSRFARQSGGSAEVQTSVGQGTCVIVRLPAHQDKSRDV